MASGLFWKILFSAISLSLASGWNDKVCTKQLLRKSYIHKFDKYTQRIVSEEKTRKSIIFQCCEGYRETSRRRELPNCEPTCNHSCGYGYCYKPNHCACYYGYEISHINGSCERISKRKTDSPILDGRFEVGSSSTSRFDRKPSSTVSYYLSSRNSAFKTTTPTISDEIIRFEKVTARDQIETARVKFDSDLGNANSASTTHNSSKVVESSTKKIDIEPSLKEVDDFPRVKFITYRDSDLATTQPANMLHKHFEVESSTKHQIDLEPFWKSIDDYPRVRFITHGDSRLKTKIPSGKTLHKSLEVDSLKPQVIGKSSKNDTHLINFIMATSSKFSTESTIIDNNRNSFKFKTLALCTLDGVCTCQMGYQLSEEKFCTQCQIGSKCQCEDGYAFDSFRCKPLCNGVFDGCIEGICIGYNECRCISGGEKVSENIFRCYSKEATTLDRTNFDRKWYILLLVIPVVIIAAFSFCIITKRSRSSKSNRLRAQRNTCQEIRYFHTNNNLFVKEKYHEADGKIENEPGFDEHAMQHEGKRILIVAV